MSHVVKAGHPDAITASTAICLLYPVSMASALHPGPARLLRLPHCPLRQYGAAGAGRPAELPAAAGCAR
jgi:hypothetical protein